ncbi:sulfite exporter TauE/SafE family protein [Vulgatibacter sp.]|uniref:sulfite exporter TauE/SafE family protein n=1 Tax=Vulgatibacter sp. TaxID=1971226 RepID=UPI00356A25A7
MQQVVFIGLVGLLAQFIDGSLGMAYGATTATLLLAIGLSPALASMITHLSEVGTTVVSAAAHQRFGNVEWRVVGWLGVPGAIGAALGAYALTSLDPALARPWMALFLLAMGAYIVVRYATMRQMQLRLGRRLGGRFLAPLGIVAGFLDAAGGGGWGPLGTSSLLASRRIEPRKAVGTIDTSEFLVASAASAGFLIGMADEPVPWLYVGALLAGGVIAAPFAAWLVRKLHPRLLGTAAGGVIALTNLHTALRALGVGLPVIRTLYVVIGLLWLLLLAWAVLRVRRDRVEAA